MALLSALDTKYFRFSCFTDLIEVWIQGVQHEDKQSSLLCSGFDYRSDSLQFFFRDSYCRGVQSKNPGTDNVSFSQIVYFFPSSSHQSNGFGSIFVHEALLNTPFKCRIHITHRLSPRFTSDALHRQSFKAVSDIYYDVLVLKLTSLQYNRIVSLFSTLFLLNQTRWVVFVFYPLPLFEPGCLWMIKQTNA